MLAQRGERLDWRPHQHECSKCGQVVALRIEDPLPQGWRVLSAPFVKSWVMPRSAKVRGYRCPECGA